MHIEKWTSNLIDGSQIKLKSHLFPTQTPSLDQLDGNHKENEKENKERKIRIGLSLETRNRGRTKKTGESRDGYGTHASPFPLG